MNQNHSKVFQFYDIIKKDQPKNFMDIRKRYIIKIIDEILSLLLKFKENNPEFTFPLRCRGRIRSKEVSLNGADLIKVILYL